MIHNPFVAKKDFYFTALFVYFAIFMAPNEQLFKIKISDSLHLTPMRAVLFIIGIITTFHILNKKINIIRTIQKCFLFQLLFLFLTIKIISLLYSSNYLGGVAEIEAFIRDIFFATACYVYYINGIINPKRIILVLIAGFVLSISVAIIQLLNITFRFDLFLPFIDYINDNKDVRDVFMVTGLSVGDTNCYATYIAAVLLIIIGTFIYSKKYLLVTAIALFLGSAILFTIQSRSSVFIFILVLIYMIIRGKVFLKKKTFLSVLIAFLTVLSFLIVLPSNITSEFFEKNATKYIRLINFIYSGDSGERTNIKGHVDMALRYIDHIDREPVAAFIGVGEGDYLNEARGDKKMVTGAHNAYVLVLGENGPIALLIFIFITWLSLKTSFFVNKYSSIPGIKSFLYFNAAYFLAFILYGSQFLQPIFWGVLGITFAEKTQLKQFIKSKTQMNVPVKSEILPLLS
jgi:hypothetical protein